MQKLQFPPNSLSSIALEEVYHVSWHICQYRHFWILLQIAPQAQGLKLTIRACLRRTPRFLQLIQARTLVDPLITDAPPHQSLLMTMTQRFSIIQLAPYTPFAVPRTMGTVIGAFLIGQICSIIAGEIILLSPFSQAPLATASASPLLIRDASSHLEPEKNHVEAARACIKAISTCMQPREH